MKDGTDAETEEQTSQSYLRHRGGHTDTVSDSPHGSARLENCADKLAALRNKRRSEAVLMEFFTKQKGSSFLLLELAAATKPS